MEIRREEEELTLSRLKQIRNSVIGNKAAKTRIGLDKALISRIVYAVHSLSNDIQIEAAHIISSLSYGNSELLLNLLQCRALQHIRDSLSKSLSRADINSSHPQPLIKIRDPKLTSSLTRALRALASSISDVLGPEIWGIREEPNEEMRLLCTDALEDLLHPSSLDAYVPLLFAAGSDVKNAIEISFLIANVVRSSQTQCPFLEWTSFPARQNNAKPSVSPSTSPSAHAWGSPGGAWSKGPPSPATTRNRRGWEKPRAPSFSSPSVGPEQTTSWVLRMLESYLSPETNGKLLEASLYALASLAKDNSEVATHLQSRKGNIDSTEDKSTTRLDEIINHAVCSQSPDIQIAASLVATTIIRASQPSHAQPHAPMASPGPQSLHRSLSQGHAELPTNPDSTPRCSNHEKSLVSILSRLIFRKGDADASDDDSSFWYPCGSLSSSSSPASSTDAINTTSDGATGPKRSSDLAADMIIRERGCYILAYLAKDSIGVIRLVLERGIVRRLVHLVAANTPIPSAQSEADSMDLDDDSNSGLFEFDEPLSVTAFRAAALLCLAYLSINEPNTRCAIVDPPYSQQRRKSSPNLSEKDVGGQKNTGLLQHLAVLLSSLRFAPPSSYKAESEAAPTLHLRTLYATLQLIRALSRSVQVMRTNLLDVHFHKANRARESGVRPGSGAEEDSGTGSSIGVKVVDLVKEDVKGIMSACEMDDGKHGSQQQHYARLDTRVVNVALMILANFVNDFSPLKQTYLSQNTLVPLLCTYISPPSGVLISDSFKSGALWCIKNLLTKTSLDTRKMIASEVGWGTLTRLIGTSSPSAEREQALAILRNVCVDEQGVDLLYSEMGVEAVLRGVHDGLESEDADVVEQAAVLLANLTNGSSTYPRSIILTYRKSSATSSPSVMQITPSAAATPPILLAVRTALSDHTSLSVRRPLLESISKLAKGGSSHRKEVLDSGLGGTLKRIVEWGGRGPARSTPGAAASGAIGRGIGGRGVIDEDREVVDLAKFALDWLEHGEIYT